MNTARFIVTYDFEAEIQLRGGPMSNRKQLQKTRLNELIIGCRENTIDAVITPFGLSRAMLQDRDGGSLPTPQNARNGTFPNEQVQDNYSGFSPDSNKFERKTLDDRGMRKVISEGESVNDGYSDRPLKDKEGDHAVSLKEASRDEWLHLFFSEKQRKALLNSSHNIVITSRQINRAKGAKSLSQFLRDGGAKKHGASAIKIRMRDIESRGYLYVNKTSVVVSELAGSGVKLATREAIGLLLAEMVKAIYDEGRNLWQLQYANVEINWAAELKLTAARIKKRLMARLKDIGEAAKSAGISGIVSALVTWVINMSIKTAKNIVGIIREAVLSLIKAGKVLFRKDASPEEKARAVAKILAGGLSVVAGKIIDESLKNLLVTVPIFQAFAPEIATVVSAIATGLLTALSIFIIDTLFDKLKYPIDAERLEAAEHNFDVQNKLCVASEALLAEFGRVHQQFEALAKRYGLLVSRNQQMISGQDCALGEIKLCLEMVHGELIFQEHMLGLESK